MFFDLNGLNGRDFYRSFGRGDMRDLTGLYSLSSCALGCRFSQGDCFMRDACFRLDFKETVNDDGDLVLSLDVPGVRADDVKVSAKGQVLTVAYSRDGEDFSIEREFEHGTDLAKASARLDLGVLTLTVPKAGDDCDCCEIKVSECGEPGKLKAKK